MLLLEQPYFLDLINSEHIHGPDDVDDHLSDPAWLAEKSAEWGDSSPISRAELKRLYALRAVLRASVQELMNDQTLTDGTLTRFQQFLSGATQRVSIEKGANDQLIVRRTPTPKTTLSRRIALSFAEYLSVGDGRRLKICHNDKCQWAFIDATKNRSKIWCEANACGNLTKVRAFRARQRLVKS